MIIIAINSTMYTFFYGTACYVCKSFKNTTNVLKYCGGCRMIAYCSIEHQKQHWRFHKKLCKSVQHLLMKNNVYNLFQEASESTSPVEWCNIRIKNIILTEIILGRQLLHDEKQMFMFPRVCEVCKASKQSELIDCNECQCISYCSTLHQEKDFQKHKLYCMQLNLSRQFDLHSMFSEDPGPFLNVIVQEKYTDLPHNITVFISKFVRYKHMVDKYSDVDLALHTELLTCPLTLLYALGKECKARSEKLVVHIVGASTLEYGSLAMWETVLHWLPQLSHLHLVFISPEIRTTTLNQHELCSDCKVKHRQLYLDFHFETFYHTYVDSDYFLMPSAVVAYNCGFHEYESADNDTWLQSIPYFLKFDQVPVVLTSYTKSEAEKDMSRITVLQKNRINISLKCEQNPYSSKRPYRDWASNGLGIFYNNNFITVLKSSSCK